MSNALTKAGSLDPELRLAQAFSDFQAALTDEQKAKLHIYQRQERASPPDSQDVLRLIAEIDNLSGGNVVGKRCFGPRLTNFLQGVQIYASVADVVVGGSQNLVVCGIWSLVRLSLLVSSVEIIYVLDSLLTS
jgi:hypothetical protein